MLIFLQAIKYSTSPGTIFHGWNAQLGWILPSGGPGEASLGRVRHLHLHINFPWHSPKCGVQVKWKNIHFQQSVPTFPMHCFPGKERPRSDRTIYLPFPSSRTFWQRRLQRRGLASTLIVVKKIYTAPLKETNKALVFPVLCRCEWWICDPHTQSASPQAWGTTLAGKTGTNFSCYRQQKRVGKWT